MSIRRLIFFFLVAVAFLVATGIPTNSLNSGQNGDEEITLISGRNVNMVSGITLPGGDPYLQRQNEPSIAVSTRNPLHLLAGANDYRTVDMPILAEELPGIPEGTAAGDAWVGVFKSYDGGQSWKTSLLPGFPQDTSAEGADSLLKEFTTAADPVVRAGTNGLFYYSGIAFNRVERGAGVVFVASFVDNNNVEGGDTIEYLDTQIIDEGNAGHFLDMPRIAVDIPRDGSSCGNVYIAYTDFLGNLELNVRSRILFSRSTDCGVTWSKPIKLSESQHIIQRATIAIDPIDGTVYVAFRRFYHKSQSNSIVIVKSVDRGQTFTKPTEVANFDAWDPFDQTSTSLSFRTNGYPTMTVDDKGVVYLAWAQRGVYPTFAARIVLATSTDGIGWSTTPEPINNPIDVASHQFMPQLTFAASKLTLVWYDQRLDFSGQEYGWPDIISDTMDIRHTIDVWAAQADTRYYPDLNWTSTQVSRYLFNLMLDEDGNIIKDDNGDPVYIQMQFNPPNYPLFKGGTWPFMGDYVDVSPSPMFIVGEDRKWRFNTEPMDNPVFHITWTDNRDVRPPIEPPFDWTNYSPPTSDQLDEYESVDRPPCPGGQGPGMRNQNIYTSRLSWGIEAGALVNSKQLDLDVPRSFVIFVRNNTVLIKIFRLTIANQPPGGQASFLQFESLESLDVKTAPYSTMTRPIFIDSSDENASVRIAIEEIDEEGNVIGDGLTSYVIINPDPDNPAISGGGVESEETHNPNIVNPNIVNWYVNPNIVNPNIVNPNIVNPNIVNPNIVNPNIVNPNIVNPNIVNPNIVNPNIINPNIVNPNIVNPNIVNPNIVNPNIVNPNIVNPNIVNANPEDPEAVIVKSVTDVGWTVINEGNTATSYTLKALAKESLPDGFYAQLLVYKVTYVPAAVGSLYDPDLGYIECELKETPQHQLLLNVVNPNIVNPNIVNPNIVNPNIVNASIENATFSVAPGEEVLVTLRIFEIEPSTASFSIQSKIYAQQFILDDFIDSLGFGIVSHSVDSKDAEMGITIPKATASILLIGTPPLPNGVEDLYYGATLRAYGGTPPYSWAANSEKLPPGLDISTNPDGTGIIFGTPTTTGTYKFIVEVTDTESQTDTQLYSITIHTGTVPESPTITTTLLPSGIQGKWYGATLEATGGDWPLTWSWSAGSTPLPDGLTLDLGGVISGTPTTTGTYNFNVTVTDKDGDSDPKNLNLEILASTGEYFTISGTVTVGVGSPPLQGVLIRGLPGTPTTDAFGFYTDTVPEGWSGTATPFKAGYYFDLPEISYTNVKSDQPNQDYAAFPVELDHFEFDVIGDQTVGTSFSITITAVDSSGDTVTTYSDSNTLSDSTGTISPITTGTFTDGIWTGDVTISAAQTGVTINTSGGGKSGVSNAFNVTAAALDHFTVDAPDSGTAGTPFSVTITAKDSEGNTTKNVSGATTLSVDGAGTITPTSIAEAEFTDDGVWTGDVTLSEAGERTITANNSGKTGSDAITIISMPTYTISGRVTVGGAGLQGVVMSGLPDILGPTPETDINGYYSGTVDYGWSGTVTPTLEGYDFLPSDRTYADVASNQANQNYTASIITYTISGFVDDNFEQSLEGVLMSGFPGTVTTDELGEYETTVNHGWSGTVTPFKTGYIFDPSSRIYSNVTSDMTTYQDYFATLQTYTISGTVWFGEEGLREVTMVGLPGDPQTNISGFYSGTVDYGWDGTVTPTLAGFTFTPSSRTYTDVASTQADQNYTVTGVPTYIISGKVVDGVGGPGLEDVDMGGFPNMTKTDPNGDYSGEVSLGWSGTVTPEKEGYDFDPVSRDYFDVHQGYTNQDYTATLTDTTPPTIISFGPADDATGVDINTNLTITFNENVVAGTGNIEIRKSSDDSIFESIPVTDAKVTIVDKVVCINPDNTFGSLTGYYVNIGINCFKDIAGNYYGGISDKTTWNFTSWAQVAYYPFSGNANDESGNGNNGTVNGAILTTDRFGNPNSAYEFDGTSNYIEVPDSNSLDITNEITIAAWVKPDISNPTDTQALVSKYRSSGTEAYCLWAYTTGTNGPRFRVETSSLGDAATTDLLSTTDWSFVVGTYDGANAKLYINGVLKNTDSGSGLIPTNSLPLRIGAGNETSSLHPFDGKIDDVHIYNRALTGPDLESLYAYERSHDFQVDAEIKIGEQALIAGDLRNDGIQRIVSGNYVHDESGAMGYIRVYSDYDADADYEEEWTKLIVPNTNGRIIPVAVGDVNNDGKNEFLVNVYRKNKLQIYQWSGSTYEMISEHNIGDDYAPAAVFDLDRDGLNELVIDDVGGISVYEYQDSSLVKVWAAGDGHCLQIAIGDPDGDGEKEAIAFLPWADPGKILVIGYDGLSYSIEATIQDFPLGGLGGGAIADFDKDGKQEMITSLFNISAIEYPIYLVKYVCGNYVVQTLDNASMGMFQIHAGDIDGDGYPEASILRNSSNSFVVEYRSGSYHVLEVVHAGAGIFGDVADVDGDGKPEILSGATGIIIISDR